MGANMSTIRRKTLRAKADKEREEAAIAEAARIQVLREVLEVKIKEWEKEQEKINPISKEEILATADSTEGVRFDLGETSELTTEKPKRTRRK